MTQYPTAYQKRTLWSAITGISLLVLGALLVGFIWTGSLVVSFLQPVLVPLAVAGIIAYLLEPVVRKLEDWGMSRFWSVFSVFMALTLFLGGLATYIGPKTYRQAAELVGQREQVVEAVKDHAETFLADHPDHMLVEWLTSDRDEDGARMPSKAEKWLETNLQSVVSTVTNLLARGFRGVGSALALFIGFFLIPIYLWFFLIESRSIQKRWDELIPLRRSRLKDEIVSTLREINDYLIAFFRGQLLVSMIDGALVGLALFAFGLPYAFIIGIAVAILGMIPYIGNLLCWIPAVFISVAHFSIEENRYSWLGDSLWVYPLAVTILFVGVQQINSFVTAPKIVGDSVGLHPMTVIFSVFFWSLMLGGALGALLAVPLTASVKVLFKRYIWEKKLGESSFGDGPNNTGNREESVP